MAVAVGAVVVGVAVAWAVTVMAQGAGVFVTFSNLNAVWFSRSVLSTSSSIFSPRSSTFSMFSTITPFTSSNWLFTYMYNGCKLQRRAGGRARGGGI